MDVDVVRGVAGTDVETPSPDSELLGATTTGAAGAAMGGGISPPLLKTL